MSGKRKASAPDEYPYSIRDVHISDPFILADQKTGFYYTYVQFADTGRFPGAKCDEPCFYVLRSPDMINWTEPKICFRKGDFWADRDYWAPECHAMLFTSFEGKLMMSLHCPNIHPKKRILLFEMEELGDRLAIRNEITGNWYNSAGGTATDWRYKVPCTEEI